MPPPATQHPQPQQSQQPPALAIYDKLVGGLLNMDLPLPIGHGH